MLVYGDIERVDLATGDRYRRVSGNGESRLIRITCWSKPIPMRQFDWEVWDDNLGADCSPIGYGRTEQEAIEDFMEHIQ